jgi:hypothetical protein
VLNLVCFFLSRKKNQNNPYANAKTQWVKF